MIKVMIVDDHNIVRQGLRNLLENVPDIDVVADADSGRSALGLVEQAAPEVILMDMSMPGMNGIEATQRIVEEFRTPHVLILSMHKDKRFVAQALKAGARGYILKDCASMELVKGIREVAAGNRYFCAGIMEVIIDDYIDLVPVSLAQARTGLTPREREVLQLIAEGHNAKNIAFLLNLSVKTVDSHRQQIMKKLNLHSVAELTKYAIVEGVTSIDG
jgi:DNA-binding NarL/FixJ family response regulator